MHFTAKHVPLALLIAIAFEVDSNQVQYKQTWIGTQTYDLATAWPGDQPPTATETAHALQCLLEERLHLSAHRQTSSQPGYALLKGKNGITLTPASEPESIINIFPNAIEASSVSMQTLAGVLGRPLGRPVVNETGVSGNFKVHLRYAALDASNSDASLPSLPAALNEQAGLLLEKRTVQREMLVVDAVDRTPAIN